MPETQDDRTGSITFVGTATVLLRLGAVTILTDPNFLHQGDHARLGYGLRSRRLTEPAMQVAELPPLDAVLLSHHHGDHFDDVAARDLDHRVPVVTTPHAARKLRRQGFEAPVALTTWDSHRISKDGTTVTVTAVPGRHGPRPVAALLPPVMGSVLDVTTADGRATRIYVTGDTLVHDGIVDVRRRYPDIDLCLIHLGGTRVAGVLVTMDDRQGTELLDLVAPARAVPIHFDDYTVFRSPLDDFVRRWNSRDRGRTELVLLERGETLSLD